jgi:hypothetical protein
MEPDEFCTAEHDNTQVGCYGEAGHEGKHWSYSSSVMDTTGQIQNDNGDWIWQWGNEAPAVPAGSVAVVLTREELEMLLIALYPASTNNYPITTAMFNRLNETLEKLK